MIVRVNGDFETFPGWAPEANCRHMRKELKVGDSQFAEFIDGRG